MGRLTVLDPPVDPQGTFGRRLGGWWHQEEGADRIVCDLCPRACTLKEGDRGFCFVRQNVGGQMVLTTYGLSTGFCVDPIEKKPLAHFYPGTSVLSFGTAGCNLGCKFCQNWSISKSREIADLSERAGPEGIAEAAVRMGCRSVAFTYNDPVIWAEYAIDCARACRERGLKAVAVTAGYITPEARPAFYAEMDAANVDLKGYTEGFYRHLCLGHMEPVLDTLKWLKHESDVWFEVTNLVIPQENDSPEEIRQMSEWYLENLGDEVPLHFTAFHPDFRLQNRPRTPPETLHMAQEIAKELGLKYVYVGNVFDKTRQSTYCPGCGLCLIERDWHELGAYRLIGNRCSNCGYVIAGHFDDAGPGDWGRRRLPVRIVEREVVAQSARGASDLGESLAPAASSGQAAPQSVADTMMAAPSAESQGLGHLDDRQRWSILQAAADLVDAAVARRTAALADPHLVGTAGANLYGVFVSLKKHGQLRACCGSFGRTMRLVEALSVAAQRAATADHRFAPISHDELPQLDMDVWLLHNPRPVLASGAERLGHVVIGKHGLVIGQGSARGLLLPGVAVEAGMDARDFLESVCRKAQLPLDAWMSDQSMLTIFEGVCLKGRLREYLPADWRPVPHPHYAGLLQFVREIWAARITGATPPIYWPQAADGDVAGILLSAKVDGGSRRHWRQLAPEGGLPLQATLFPLAQEAIQDLVENGIRGYSDLTNVQLRLILLTRPLRQWLGNGGTGLALDAKTEALVLEQGDRRALVLPPQRDPGAMLQQASGVGQIDLSASDVTAWTFGCIKLEDQPTAAEVLARSATTAVRRGSRAAVPSTAPPGPAMAPGVAPQRPALASNPSRPNGSTRRPAKAGMFYPADAAALAQMVQDFLGTGDVETAPWPAILVPHAGLRFSGRLAARTFRRVQLPPSAIIIGPKHTPKGVPWAIEPHDRWAIPGGVLETDRELADALANAVPDLAYDTAAHEDEHGIEVELPFVHALAPQTRVVGVALGYADLEDCRLFAQHLAEVIRERKPRPLLVVSSDMNHFAPEPENRRLDRMAIDAMLRRDPEALYEVCVQNRISMCGMRPAVIVMEALRQLGRLSRAELVGYTTSAEASGDTSSVVGYCGMLFE